MWPEKKIEIRTPGHEDTRKTPSMCAAKLTNAEVRRIVESLPYEDRELIEKLCQMFPAVKAGIVADRPSAGRAQPDRRRDEEGENPQRKAVTDTVIEDIDLSLPVLNQLKTWISLKENWTSLTEAGSDEIYLASDLWRFYFKEIRGAGLIQELRTRLKAKSCQKWNAWVKDKHKITTDEDMWRGLVKELEQVTQKTDDEDMWRELVEELTVAT